MSTPSTRRIFLLSTSYSHSQLSSHNFNRKEGNVTPFFGYFPDLLISSSSTYKKSAQSSCSLYYDDSFSNWLMYKLTGQAIGPLIVWANHFRDLHTIKKPPVVPPAWNLALLQLWPLTSSFQASTIQFSRPFVPSLTNNLNRFLVIGHRQSTSNRFRRHRSASKQLH